MKINSLEILNPGLLTTVQDMGRWGYQQYGMPVCGVMDEFSYRCANALVGNKSNEACLEVTLLGPEIRFRGNIGFAVTGGDFDITLNGKKINMWTYYHCKDGYVLKFGKLKAGARAYLAIGGGIDVEEVMGSRSTYLRGKLGGHEGRALAKGDIVPVGRKRIFLRKSFVNESEIPKWMITPEVRVLLGVNADAFSDEVLDWFGRRFYHLDPASDRMGYRLHGTAVEHRTRADVFSYGIVKGAIQVPGDGQPIIMMADHQTTGGYTQIASIIAADICRVAQLKPGDYLKFRFVEYDEAIEALKKQEKLIKSVSCRGIGV